MVAESVSEIPSALVKRSAISIGSRLWMVPPSSAGGAPFDPSPMSTS
jgi:hypothetical protein